MFRKLFVGAMIVGLELLSTAPVHAGDVSLLGHLFFNSDSGKFQAMDFKFVNPNDVSVDLNLIVLKKDHSEGTPPYNSVDVFTPVEDGLQTITIPAFGVLRISSFDLPGPDFEECLTGIETFGCAFVTVKANWPDSILGTDGTLKKTPLEVYQLIFDGHFNFENEKPDDISYGGITQIR